MEGKFEARAGPGEAVSSPRSLWDMGLVG